MKKLLIGALVIFILVFITGCGGGGNAPVGATMTNEEANAKFLTAMEGMNAVDTNKDYVALPGVSSLSASSLPLRARASVTLTWNGPDSQGWYSASETINTTTFSYQIRYLEASNKIEIIESYTFGSVSFTVVFSVSEVSTGVYTGNMKVTTVSSVGTRKFEYYFTNVHSMAYSGTFDIYIEFNGSDTSQSFPRTHWVHYAVSYDSNHTPPIYVVGWFWNGIGRQEINQWQTIPTLTQ